MKHFKLKLSSGDDLAIMAAMELLQTLDMEETEEQVQYNDSLIGLVFFKLSSKTDVFTADEARIICAAVCAARYVPSGQLPADPEEKQLLSPYMFHYNRLWPQLQPISDKLQ